MENITNSRVGQVFHRVAQMSKKKPIKAFITNPLAYICLRELRDFLESPDIHVYVITWNTRIQNQIKELAKMDNGISVSNVTPSFKTPALAKMLYLPIILTARIRLWIAMASLHADDRIVVAQLSSPYIKYVIRLSKKRKKKIIAVDDGLSTLVQYGILSDIGYLDTESQQKASMSFLSRLENLIFSNHVIYADDISYFSFFPLEAFGPALLRRNTFPSIREMKKFQKSENFVYFIGQPHTRAGRTSKEDYKKLIMDVAKFYRNRNLRMVYFPHPKEDTSQFEGVIEIRRPVVPFEMYLINQEEIPVVVSSIFSTSIFICQSIFGNQMKYELIWTEPVLRSLLKPNHSLLSSLMFLTKGSNDFTIVSSFEKEGVS